jgi:DNA adenine methylase
MVKRTLPDRGKAKPFLKWAGGKTQLLESFERRFPSELADQKISNYVEPFVGGGAVFFSINKKYEFKTAYICDINEELILAYHVVKFNVNNLIEKLRILETSFSETPEPEQTLFYYKIRDDFNRQKENIDFYNYRSSWIKRAAELIFLNHTCFNGLFRVNSKGQFNVPFGRYKKPRILDENTLLEASASLDNTEIIKGDFTTCEQFIDANTFVYLDPPYRPLNLTSKFTGYSKSGFNDDDQIRLAHFYKSLDKTGAKIMLSNSDPKNENPDDTFFDSLYSDYFIDRVSAKRAINSNGERRGGISELIITNYQTYV